eukprot:32549-Chlamydomonas_euryale.AAC.1
MPPTTPHTPGRALFRLLPELAANARLVALRNVRMVAASRDDLGCILSPGAPEQVWAARAAAEAAMSEQAACDARMAEGAATDAARAAADVARAVPALRHAVAAAAWLLDVAEADEAAAVDAHFALLRLLDASAGVRGALLAERADGAAKGLEAAEAIAEDAVKSAQKVEAAAADAARGARFAAAVAGALPADAVTARARDAASSGGACSAAAAAAAHAMGPCTADGSCAAATRLPRESAESVLDAVESAVGEVTRMHARVASRLDRLSKMSDAMQRARKQAGKAAGGGRAPGGVLAAMKAADDADRGAAALLSRLRLRAAELTKTLDKATAASSAASQSYAAMQHATDAAGAAHSAAAAA